MTKRREISKFPCSSRQFGTECPFLYRNKEAILQIQIQSLIQLRGTPSWVTPSLPLTDIKNRCILSSYFMTSGLHIQRDLQSYKSTGGPQISDSVEITLLLGSFSSRNTTPGETRYFPHGLFIALKGSICFFLIFLGGLISFLHPH